MGRGVSSGGGQSSLDYLFGSGGEVPKRTAASSASSATQAEEPVKKEAPSTTNSPPVDFANRIPAGINSSHSNNYLRADGQNTGNFITDRPSTKVHAAPGGGSSLGYLFGGGSN